MPILAAILPTTRTRAPFLPLALRGLDRQGLGNDVELIVVSEDPEVFDVIATVPTQARVTSVLSAHGLSLGTKRNIGCEAATAPWFTAWDDDDWSRPDRLRLTLAACRPDVDLVGSQTMLVHELATRERRTGVYRYTQRREDWPSWYFLGGLLTFRRELWREVPFGDHDMGEETWWQRKVEGASRAEFTADPTCYVQMIHGNNTGYRQLPLPGGSPGYSLWDGDFQALLGDDLRGYEHVCRNGPLPRAAD